MMDAQMIAGVPDVAAWERHGAAAGGFALSRDIILAHDPDGARAEVLRSLRTQLMERHLRRGKRAIAVCGPGEGVGVSFMAANLAVGFARAGANTLLIDANMRKPTIQDFIVPDRAVSGLAQCLSTDWDGYAGAIQANVIPNLSVLYSGGPDGEALEKLSGPRFQPLMAMCMRDFDFIIADTPPANRYADVLQVAAAAGHGLIILRRHLSFVDDADALIGQLRASRVGVAGIMLNEF